MQKVDFLQKHHSEERFCRKMMFLHHTYKDFSAEVLREIHLSAGNLTAENTSVKILLQKIFLMISLQKIFLWTAQTERRLLTPWYNSCDFVTYGAGFVQPKTMALLVWCIWPKYFYLATKNIVCRQDLSRRESNTIHRLQFATFKTMLIIFRNLLSPSS